MFCCLLTMPGGPPAWSFVCMLYRSYASITTQSLLVFSESTFTMQQHSNPMRRRNARHSTRWRSIYTTGASWKLPFSLLLRLSHCAANSRVKMSLSGSHMMMIAFIIYCICHHCCCACGEHSDRYLPTAVFKPAFCRGKSLSSSQHTCWNRQYPKGAQSHIASAVVLSTGLCL